MSADHLLIIFHINSRDHELQQFSHYYPLSATIIELAVIIAADMAIKAAIVLKL